MSRTFEIREVGSGSGGGALCVIIIGLILLIGSCSDSRNVASNDTSSNDEGYIYEETYDSGEYEEDFEEDLEYNDGELFDTCTDVETELPTLASLCFYEGKLTSTDSLDDCFGTTHYDVVYNSMSYLYNNYNDKSEYFANRYYLGGDFQNLSFNVFSTSGDVDIYGTVSVYASYGDTATDETLIYSIDMNGGQIPVSASIDLTGVTFLRLTISTFDCINHANRCHIGIGDIKLS